LTLDVSLLKLNKLKIVFMANPRLDEILDENAEREEKSSNRASSDNVPNKVFPGDFSEEYEFPHEEDNLREEK
jgi:hypothetical protein